MKLVGSSRGRTASVGLFLALLLISVVSVHSRTCLCKKHIGVDLTFGGCTNYSCETATGVCYVDLKVDDKTGIYSYTYDCLEENNNHGFPPVIGCNISPTAMQVLLCCNTTDYCNRDLRPDLKLVQQSAMSPTSTPLVTTDSGPTSGQGDDVEVVVVSVGAVLIVIVLTVSVTALVIFLCYLYRRREMNRLIEE